MFPSFRSLAVSAGCLIAIVFLAVTIFLNIRDVLYAVVCVEDRVVEVTSPDARYVARSVRSNCGSISPFTTRVYIRTAGWGITRLRPDLVFLHRGEPDDLHLRWVTTQALVIEHNACYAVIGTQRATWHDVSITYHEREGLPPEYHCRDVPPLRRIPLPSGRYWAVAWLPNGWLVVADESSRAGQQLSRLWRLRPDGTEWRQLPLVDNPNCRFTGYRHPTALPDGRLGFEQVCVADRRIEQATGQTADSRGLWAYGWETGATARLVAALLPFPAAQYTWNPAMTRGLLAVDDTTCASLAWITPAGVELPTFSVRARAGHWRLDEHLRHWSRPCTEESRASWPAWSPDGQTIAFWASPQSIGVEGAARLDQLWNLYLMNPENAQPRLVTEVANVRDPRGLAWSPDGRWLAFVGEMHGFQDGLWLYTPGVPHLRLVARWEHLQSPTWSPDGQQLIVIEHPPHAHASDRTGAELLLFDVSGIVAAS